MPRTETYRGSAMARTVTWDELRNLAGFEAEKGRAISLYLDLDPSISPTAGDAATRLNSLLDEGARADGANRRDLSHPQRRGRQGASAPTRRYFGAEFSRNGAHGLAIFCAGLDNVWRPLPLTETVSDEIKIGHRLYLAPLVPLVGRGEGALVVVVSRELGHFYRLQAGRLEDIADHFDEQPRRHDQGGWSQARFQRHVDTLAQEHLRAVAEALDRLVRRLRGPQVVVVASEDTWAEFSGLLSQESRNAVAGVTHAEAHAAPGELLQPATPVAASDGRVEVLLFQEGASRSARRCPACGRVAAEESKCPLDGTQMEDSDDGIDLAVHQTLAHGGTVWAVGHRRDLDPVEGIGALLRY